MTAAFFSNLGPAHRPQTRPALAGLPLHSCSRVTTLGSRRFWTSGPQSGSYLSFPSSLMAIGLDIRRPAKEDFMSVFLCFTKPPRMPFQPSFPSHRRHKRMRELRGDWREPSGTRVSTTSYVAPAAD